MFMEEIRFESDCNTSIPHFHSELEILYVLSGRIAIIGSGYNYVLEPEDFIVLNPYEHHEMYAEAGCHTVSGYISPDILRQAELGRISCCTKSVPEQTDYPNLIRARFAMLFKYSINQPAQKLYILSQLFGLLAILKTQYEVDKNRPVSTYRDADRMQEVLSYLSMHFSENISMQEVADRVYLSKSHLSREFQKNMGIPFSEYLRKLRLNHVAYLLCHTQKTITDIALSSGYSNVNTMILNFHEKYGDTPSSYRKKYYEKESHFSASSSQCPETAPLHINSYMSLLKHAASEEVSRPLDKKQQAPMHIQASLLTDMGPLHLCHNDTINIGWANSLMTKALHQVLERTVKEIGFRYIRFHGILDDSMDLYHEDADGTPWLSYTYLDIVIDEILELGLKPFFEFGYTPYNLVEKVQNIFGTSCMNIPNTPILLDKWQFVVESVMAHLLERYGSEEVLQWRFCPINALYIFYQIFSTEEYLVYYERTFQGIRNLTPDAQIYGFGLDTGFLSLNGPKVLETMLDYCIDHNCMPNAFTFQCFGCDYSKIPLNKTEDKISSDANRQSGEPASVSANPDILKHEIALCKKILQKYGLGDRPFHIIEWNSTIWQSDLGNDTCFKAAFIMKNILENRNIDGIAYTHLTDHSEKRVLKSSLYHGGYGLLTYNGIPKAGYFAYQFLTMLKQEKGIIAASGNGYLITRSKDYKRFQIVLYHYCHYDMQNRIDYAVSSEEQRTADRYYGFMQSGTKTFHLHLTDIPQGTYLKRCFSITREHGSSYDTWMMLGAPELRGRQQMDYLSNISTFGLHYEPIHITDTQEWTYSTLLDEHEVRLILIDKK